MKKYFISNVIGILKLYKLSCRNFSSLCFSLILFLFYWCFNILWCPVNLQLTCLCIFITWAKDGVRLMWAIKLYCTLFYSFSTFIRKTHWVKWALAQLCSSLKVQVTSVSYKSLNRLIWTHLFSHFQTAVCPPSHGRQARRWRCTRCSAPGSSARWRWWFQTPGPGGGEKKELWTGWTLGFGELFEKPLSRKEKFGRCRKTLRLNNVTV